MVDDEEVLTECSAAMLLMKLSCSPHASAAFPASYSDLPSPSAASSSSGAESSSDSGGVMRSATPSPPLSSSHTDEGIVKDLSMRHRTVRLSNIKILKTQELTVEVSFQIIYQCTFPGCRQQCSSVASIECHVRKQHLNRPEFFGEEEQRDHEEEFYYTELETGTNKRQTPAKHPVFTHILL